MAVAKAKHQFDDVLKEFRAEDGRAVFASRPSQSRGRVYDEPPSKTRSAFQRDRDRVIHARSFRRLKHKTQVFIASEGDYYRTRLTHSLEVAQVARSFARSLRLDEDLAEVCALAHDMGHTPFAHVGEEALQECMEPYGGFDHNDQTLRVITKLEKRYPRFDGLNLTWESLEGLCKHNGPVTGDLEITLKELSTQTDMMLNTYASVEAQVAGIADDVAYNSHDLDDGLAAGFFTLSDLIDVPFVGEIIHQKRKEFPDCPEYILCHEVIREVMGRIALDVLDETQKRLLDLKPKTADDVRHASGMVVAFSEEMEGYDKTLRSFLWDNFYINDRLSRIRMNSTRVVSDLFKAFFENERCLTPFWRDQIPNVPEGWTETNWKARVIADYIAGMTDRKALQVHKEMYDAYEGLR